MSSYLQDLVESASVNNKDLFSTMRQYVEELAISFGQYFP